MNDPISLKPVKELSRADILFCMARMPGSSRLFFGSSDFKVYEGDVLAEKFQPREMAGHQGWVQGMALASERLVTGGSDKRLIWWDAQTGEKLRQVDGAHERQIRAVVASPDGRLVATVGDDMVCRLWDARTGERVRELRGHEPKTPHHYPSMLFTCSFSRDSKLLATGDKVGHIVVWDVASGRPLETFEAPGLYTWDPRQRRHSIGGVRSLAFSPDSRLLAAGGIGQIGNIDHLGAQARIEVFDRHKAEKLCEVEDDKFKGLVEQLHFHSSGSWLLAAGGDNGGFVTFWDLDKKSASVQEKVGMHVHAIAFDESEQTLFAAGHGKIAVFSVMEQAIK